MRRSGLSKTAQLEFQQLWDTRRDDTGLYGARHADGSVEWKQLPIETRGLIIEGRVDGSSHDWNDELYEYLINHPESVVILAGRQFHVCRAHAHARAVSRNGIIPPDFDCPLSNQACPLRTLCNAAGGAVMLSGHA
jgi:hypothetical protein